MLLLLLLALLPQTEEDRVRGLLRVRLEAGRGVGLAAGIVDETGARVIGAGSRKKGGPEDICGDTLFEIGSITKTFTALLLADMAGRGELGLEDPVAGLLPAGVRVPERKERKITLLDLVQHRSGLPRMPDNFKPADPRNPYADYSVPQMYAFLSGHTLVRTSGAFYEYSNLGAGLLGHALALRAGKTYEALVAERITGPLKLEATSIGIPPGRRPRLALPYSEDLGEASNWDLPTLAGAGALRSSASDLLRYLAAHLGLVSSPLDAALAATHGRRAPTGMPGVEISLGWHVFTRNGKTIYTHSGGTGGYRTFAGFDPAARRGVVVLGNSEHSVDDLGMHLLDPKSPLQTPQKAVDVDAATLDRYTGAYELAPGFILTLTRRDRRLFGQATGQAAFPLTSVSATRFEYPEAGIILRFPEQKEGPVPGLKFEQGGPAIDVRRVGSGKD